MDSGMQYKHLFFSSVEVGHYSCPYVCPFQLTMLRQYLTWRLNIELPVVLLNEIIPMLFPDIVKNTAG